MRAIIHCLLIFDLFHWLSWISIAFEILNEEFSKKTTERKGRKEKEDPSPLSCSFPSAALPSTTLLLSLFAPPSPPPPRHPHRFFLSLLKLKHTSHRSFQFLSLFTYYLLCQQLSPLLHLATPSVAQSKCHFLQQPNPNTQGWVGQSPLWASHHPTSSPVPSRTTSHHIP